jgi:hypothetical protein
MMFIGGGAGMAPMRSHLFHLFHTVKEKKKKVTFWYGARSWKEVFYYDQFRDIEKNFDNFDFQPGPFGAAARRQMGRPNRVYPPGNLRQLPEQTRGARGNRLLPVRPAHDERCQKM